MWKLGKSVNILSLAGHQSPVECVTFDTKEEKVIAGSQGGSLKVFHLQEAKVLRTLSGHMSACTSLDCLLGDCIGDRVGDWLVMVMLLVTLSWFTFGNWSDLSDDRQSNGRDKRTNNTFMDNLFWTTTSH